MTLGHSRIAAARSDVTSAATGRTPPTEYERIKQLDFLNFNEAKSPSYVGTPFNARQAYLNKDVRQALLHALDREAIAQVIYAGAVTVVDSQISVPGIEDSPNLKKYEYDPEKAKALLQSGGWDSSRKIRWAVGQVPTDEVTLAYYAAVNGYWEEVGVQAEFQVFGKDSTVLWAPNWDFDLYPSTYPIGIPESVAIHYDPSRASYVSSGYDTPEFRDLWLQSMRQHPQEEYQSYIWQLQETLAEEALGLTVVHSADIWGTDKRVHGLVPNYFPYEDNLYDWQLEKIWVEPKQ